MNRNIFVPFLLIWLAIACNAPEKSQNKVTTATLNGPSAMAMIKMIDDKPIVDGIQLDFIIKNEPNHVRAMMLNNEIDFALLPTTMAALLYNRNQAYILAAIPVWGTLYLFGSDSTVREWEDLKGKKISLMARGMTPDIMFRYLAEKNGLDPSKDMELDYSFPSHIELANAVSAGIVKIGVISEPLVSLVMQKNRKVHPILDFNEEWIRIFGNDVPFAQTALLVKKTYAREHPRIVNAYLDKLEKSINWVNANPALAAELIVKYGILPEKKLAMEAIPFSNLRFVRAWETRQGIDEYLRVFYNYSPLILGGTLPDEKFYFKSGEL